MLQNCFVQEQQLLFHVRQFLAGVPLDGHFYFVARSAFGLSACALDRNTRMSRQCQAKDDKRIGRLASGTRVFHIESSY